MHLSAVGRDLIGLDRLTLAGIIQGAWLSPVIPGASLVRRACLHRPRRTLAGTEGGRKTEGLLPTRCERQGTKSYTFRATI